MSVGELLLLHCTVLLYYVILGTDLVCVPMSHTVHFYSCITRPTRGVGGNHFE